ncbi:hypothetical protein EBR43_06300 [bacterium]|nr:hypothetical protein [bacterium]
MSRIRCSQCGQEGHNRRNRECPVNVQQRSSPTSVAVPASEEERHLNIENLNTTPVLINPRANRYHTYFNRATHNFEILVNLMNTRQQQNMSVSGFILGCVAIVQLICNDMCRALEHDNVPAIHASIHSGFFQQLEHQVQTLNEMIRTLNSSATVRVFVYLTDTGRFKMTLVETAERRKRTSAYFKEISLVVDLTIEEGAPGCECPICFDEMPAQDAIYTNCKHSYCGTCLKGLATSIKDKTEKPCCSMCRTDITHLTFGKREVFQGVSQHFKNL